MTWVLLSILVDVLVESVSGFVVEIGLVVLFEDGFEFILVNVCGFALDWRILRFSLSVCFD